MIQKPSRAAGLALAATSPSRDSGRQIDHAASALHGAVRDDPRTRQEFLALTMRTAHDQ